jgi:hypothetical protein
MLILFIIPCAAVSVSIESNNNNGFEKVSETISMDTLGEFHGKDVIGSDFRYHIDKGFSTENCKFSLEYWVPYTHGPIPMYSVSFGSNNRNTAWIDEMYNSQVNLEISSKGW